MVSWSRYDSSHGLRTHQDAAACHLQLFEPLSPNLLPVVLLASFSKSPHHLLLLLPSPQG